MNKFEVMHYKLLADQVSVADYSVIIRCGKGVWFSVWKPVKNPLSNQAGVMYNNVRNWVSTT